MELGYSSNSPSTHRSYRWVSRASQRGCWVGGAGGLFPADSCGQVMRLQPFTSCCFPLRPSATGPTPTATLPRPPPPAALTCATATTRQDDGLPSSPAPPSRATPATSTTTRSRSRLHPRPAASTCLRRRTARAARRRLTPSAVIPTTSTRHHPRPAQTPREKPRPPRSSAPSL